jgi:hypothetical protein
VLISLAAMRASELFPAKRVGRQKRQVRQGLHYVRSTPELLIPLIMIAVIGTLAWEFQVSLPLMASKVFHGGAASYGVMASVMGAGAVVGGLISAARSRPRTRALCLAAIGWVSPSWRPRWRPAWPSNWPPWSSSATAASRSTR